MEKILKTAQAQLRNWTRRAWTSEVLINSKQWVVVKVGRWKIYARRAQWSITDIRYATDRRRNAFKWKILLHSNAKNQRARQLHNKSFAATVALLWILKQQMKQRWKRERTVCYKPRNLKHRGITRKLEYLLKLYSRELSSTIDPYKNGENAYIYLN